MPAEKRPSHLLEDATVFPSTSTTARSSPKPGGQAGSDENSQHTASEGKDYTVCDQCRLKKIRCGRERPSCSNCSRLGLECEWSGYGKKPNQTIMLSHTVMGLGARVGQLEKTISGIQDTLAKLNPDLYATSLLTPAPVRPMISHQLSASTSTSTSPSSHSSPGSRKVSLPPGQFHLIQGADGLQQYVGPTSLDSLIHNFSQSVIAPMCQYPPRNDPTSSRMIHAVEKLKALTNQEEGVDFVHDGSPPTSPPLVILEAMIDPYFDHINSHAPIWSRDYFRRRVETFQESGDELRYTGDVVCFNSLVLLTLTAKILRAAAKEIHSGSSRAGMKSIDSDLSKSFLANAMRAVQSIEALMKPRLINVQALLSLYLVAQIYWSSERASLLLNLAATAARSIGLHQWEPSQGQLSSEEARERQQVFCCLYILDKSRCWMDGRPPNVQMHNPDVWATRLKPRHDQPSKFVARVILSRIEEEIYSKLYSDGLCKGSAEHLDPIIANLGQELQQCWSAYGTGTLDDALHVFQMPSSDLEFSIATHAIRVFLCWSTSKKSNVDEQLLSSATTCLTLIQRLWIEDSGLGNHSSVVRTIATYAPLSFFQLSRHVLLSQVNDSDITLLKSLVEALQSISQVIQTNTTITRLASFGEIILDLLHNPSAASSSKAQSSLIWTTTLTPSYQDNNSDLLTQNNSAAELPYVMHSVSLPDESISYSSTRRILTSFHKHSFSNPSEPVSVMDNGPLPDFSFLMGNEPTELDLNHWTPGNTRAFTKDVE